MYYCPVNSGRTAGSPTGRACGGVTSIIAAILAVIIVRPRLGRVISARRVSVELAVSRHTSLFRGESGLRTMNSYAAASVDSKDSIACLQSYHRGGFVDYGRLYQTPQSSTAAYLDQYRLQQAAAYPASEHAASGSYSASIGGGKTTAAGYDPATVGYGFFDLQETFRRDQWSLLGSTAGQDGTGGGLKRLDSGGEKTAVSRPCGGTAGDVERSAAAQGNSGGGGALTDSVQIKSEDGVRPTHRPEASLPHHHHHHQSQHASSRAAMSGCSPTKHQHSKHNADSIKSNKGTTKRTPYSFLSF